MMNQTTKKVLKSIMSICMMAMVAIALPSCGSDEPDDNGGGDSATGMVTASELAGTWTLVKNRVLYSETDSGKDDKTIDYSGNASPRYKYYKVTVSDDVVITMVETSVSGSTVGTPVKYELKGNDLVLADNDKVVAGTVENYNPSHAWNNLQIRWNADYSPVSFGAPVVSYYML